MWFYISIFEYPKLFPYALFIYFLNLLFFGVTKRYLISKSFIILSCLTLFSILTIYYYIFNNLVIEHLNFYFQATNFTQNIGLIDFNISFQLNSLTYLFSLLVFLIGFCTNMYALNYFKNEADEMGFLFWLNAFILSMVILVLASNFFTLFLGWELIGLTSFFLINFWQSRRSTLKSSFKAFSFNLASDVFLLSSLILLYTNLHTTSIATINVLLLETGVSYDNWSNLAAFLLILCASIKSVQLFGHLWLPDSMEAPVPASSLIHSATLVSAGVFLLLRFNALIILTHFESLLIYWGAITAAYGGVVAAAQTDMKKLLAYSTMSHCGFLFVLVGVGDQYITIIYLFLHGLFKASTFFCVGSFVRFYGTQDTRLMGGGSRLLWADTIYLILCAANLCGLPLTVGITYKLFFFKALFTSSFTAVQIGLLYIALLSSIAYFYRLLSYCLFDRWKYLWANSPFIFLAFHSRNQRDRRIPLYRVHRNDSHIVTFGHWCAIFIIMVFSFYTYFILYYFNLVAVKDYNLVSSIHLNSNLLTIYLSSFYTNYLIFFYLLYIITFLIITLFTWRKNFFYYDKIFFYLYIPICLILLLFF